MKWAAKLNADSLGKLTNSITSGAGNYAGFLGEELVHSLYPCSQIVNTYDYDIQFMNATADVKTKRTTVVPLPSYDCSVAAYNTKQVADHYIFCRVHEDFHRGWVLGFLPKDEYFNKSRYLTKGEIDPANNFIVKADCYNVSINDLWCISNLPDYC
jgi:hypothetical protein